MIITMGAFEISLTIVFTIIKFYPNLFKLLWLSFLIKILFVISWGSYLNICHITISVSIIISSAFFIPRIIRW